ncbi:MAG: toprim domain-containing protein [Bacteroidales bacterium]|nr:toprim domain-containing protein [Bacteroidales bacterium]
MLYLKEVSFSVGTTHYFALGFKNNKGGYELRSKYFKGSSSPKYYTLIKGQNKTTINLFEGFFDFLSALTYYDLQIPNNDTIILNSLTFLSDVQPLLAKFQKINAYLDNDRAGTKALSQLKNGYPYLKNRSQEIYPECDDFNNYLKNLTKVAN